MLGFYANCFQSEPNLWMNQLIEQKKKQQQPPTHSHTKESEEKKAK